MKNRLLTIKRIFSLAALAICLFSCCFTSSTASADVKFNLTSPNLLKPKITLDKTSAQLFLSKKKMTLNATIDGIAKASVKSITWSSSNTSVATVSDKGVVTAGKCGTVTITIAVKPTLGFVVKETCRLAVYDGSISLSSSSLSMNLPDSSASQKLTCSVKYIDMGTTNVIWSSSDKSVATVSDKGVVTAKKPGTATITCKHKEYGTTATCKVTVTNKKVLNVQSREQSTRSCCGGAAAYAVIRFFDSSFSKKDTDLYKAMGNDSTVGKITDQMNKYIKKSPYSYGTYNTQTAYQNAVIKSIKAGYPVVALIKITSNTYFKYTTSGHFTVIRGYEVAPNGSVTFYIADSYFTNKNGGYFTIPASTFFGYSKSHAHKYYLILKK